MLTRDARAFCSVPSLLSVSSWLRAQLRGWYSATARAVDGRYLKGSVLCDAGRGHHALESNTHGCCFTMVEGDCYIVLHTFLRGSSKAYNVHFWLGSKASQVLISQSHWIPVQRDAIVTVL